MHIYDKDDNVPLYDLGEISFFGNESEFITLPNETFKITGEYNVFFNDIIYHVYECRHIRFEKLNPKINILNDYLLDKYEELLPLFAEHINNGWILILYSYDLNDNNYTIFRDSDSLYYGNYNDTEIKNYEFMKMVQALLILTNNFKVMLIYNMFEKYNDLSKLKDYEEVVYYDKVYIVDNGDSNFNKYVTGKEVLLNYLDDIYNDDVKIYLMEDLNDVLIKVDIIYDSLYNKYILSK